MKEKMNEMRKKGEISGDSFGGADEQRASRERFNGVPLTPQRGNSRSLTMLTALTQTSLMMTFRIGRA
jgi:hypothetical protein